MGLIKVAQPKTRRGFVKELAAGSAGVAVAGALRAALRPSNEELMAAPAVQTPPKGELKYRKYFTTELTPEEYEIG